MITVHDRTATVFTATGQGVLDKEIINPTVAEELGGGYTLTFQYPADAPAAQRLTLEAIVACPVPGMMLRQGFRIHEVDTALDGILEITAFHVFYDLAANLIADTFVVNKTAKQALDQILGAANTTHRITATSSDTASRASARIVRMPVVQALMDTGEDNTFASRWGGELTRDNWAIHHSTRRGRDGGVVIRDRKNLTGYTSSVDYSTVVTRILPVGYDGLLLPELYVDSPKLDAYVTPRIRVMRYGNVKAIKDPDKPREDELPLDQAHAELRRLAALEYSVGKVDEPAASYKVSFVDLASTREYADLVQLETVLLGDTVTVRHADLGVTLTARVVGYNYNPLRNAYVSVELGSVAAKFTNLTRQVKAAENVAVAAEGLAGVALASADGKNTNHYSTMQPTTAVLGDTWFKTNGDQVEIWIYQLTDTGEPGWVAVATDLNHAHVTAELQAAQAEVEAAKQLAEQANTTAGQVSTALAAAQVEITAAKNAASQAQSKATSVEQATTQLSGRLDTANTEIAEAKQQATQAQQTATAAQTTANQVNTQLATAQTEIANAKAAASQAQAKATQVEQTASQLDSRLTTASSELAQTRQAVTAVETSVSAARARANEAFTLASSKTTVDQVENIVKTSADGKNRITLSTAAASGSGVRPGDTWWQRTNERIVGQWTWTGSAWLATTVSHQIIASVDVNSLVVTGTARMSKAVVERIVGDAAFFGVLAANKIVVGDGTNLWADPNLTLDYGGWTLNPSTGRLERIATGAYHGIPYMWSQIPVRPGEKYVGTFQFTRTDPGQRVMLGVRRRITATNSWPSSGNIAEAKPGQDTVTSYVYTVPDGVDALRFGIFTDTYATPGVGLEVWDIRLWRQTPSVLIEDGAITADKIQAGAITTGKIQAGAVTSDKLTIANGFIVNAMIADATIQSAKIAALDASKITTGYLAAARIQAGTITSDKLTIANGFIVTAMIKDAAITNAKIAAVDAAKITTGYLAAARIQAGSITSDKLTVADGFIVNAMIADATIQSAKIAALDASKITTGYLAAARIQAGSITSDKLTIANGFIATAMIADAAITDAKIASLSAAKITTGTLAAARIAAGSITSDKLTIANGFIVTAMIKDAAVTNAKIANLDAAKITTGYLSASRIQAGTLTADKLASNAIQVGLAGWTQSIRITPYQIGWYASGVLEGKISSSGMQFWYDTRYIGEFARRAHKDKPDVQGIVSQLAYRGDYVAWTYQTTSGGTYYTCLTLDPKGRFYDSAGIHLGSDLRTNGYKFYTSGSRYLTLQDCGLSGLGTYPGWVSPNGLAKLVFHTYDVMVVTNGSYYNMSRLFDRVKELMSRVNELIRRLNYGWIVNITGSGSNISWSSYDNTGLSSMSTKLT